ncbi:hypothetical protein CALVIDRAFT_539147 [Calocera viscosa TUFC12733]|uniref:Uncharacterized protein n=1 Tax=Calocera viscosa (strain TUFC12733) TaxID=1330018 RepID=A0A167K9D7_CALVF|nr:hypothetical protein CALVIDRAFT_539147 [Calocera viscosa TUFC12733]
MTRSWDAAPLLFTRCSVGIRPRSEPRKSLIAPIAAIGTPATHSWGFLLMLGSQEVACCSPVCGALCGSDPDRTTDVSCVFRSQLMRHGRPEPVMASRELPRRPHLIMVFARQTRAQCDGGRGSCRDLLDVSRTDGLER